MADAGSEVPNWFAARDGALTPGVQAGLTCASSSEGCRTSAIKLPIQDEGGIDQRQVGEGLWEVADLLAGERDFL